MRNLAPRYDSKDTEGEDSQKLLERSRLTGALREVREEESERRKGRGHRQAAKNDPKGSQEEPRERVNQESTWPKWWAYTGKRSWAKELKLLGWRGLG